LKSIVSNERELIYFKCSIAELLFEICYSCLVLLFDFG
jgi:hypothetical protein